MRLNTHRQFASHNRTSMDSSKVTRAADFGSCEKNDLRNRPTIDFFMFVNALMTPIVFYESATFAESIALNVFPFSHPMRGQCCHPRLFLNTSAMCCHEGYVPLPRLLGLPTVRCIMTSMALK
jgi:hypothetical protein